MWRSERVSFDRFVVIRDRNPASGTSAFTNSGHRSRLRYALLTQFPTPTKLVIVMHDLAHQLLDQLLADRAVSATVQFCNRLRESDYHLINLAGIDLV
jgi:hypothetical protein